MCMSSPGAATGLFYAHARFRSRLQSGEEYSRCRAAVAWLRRGGEHHPFGDAEAHLARGQVGDHHGVASLELLGRVRGLDAGEYRSRLAAEVQRELQKES